MWEERCLFEPPQCRIEMLDPFGRSCSDHNAITLRPCTIEESRQSPLERGRHQMVETDFGQVLLTQAHRQIRPLLVLLVVLRDEAVEEPDTECGRTLGNGRCVLCRPGCSGDVEMRPGYVIDKALQKLCANDTAAGPPAGDVFYVGCITVDLSVVAFGERQTP